MVVTEICFVTAASYALISFESAHCVTNCLEQNPSAQSMPLTVRVLSKLFSIYAAEGPSNCSQNLATDPYAAPTVSSPRPVSFRYVFILFSRI
jgi:hypothetical protein